MVVTSAPERPLLHFGRIVVVGGGCYGGYYVRQLLRAQRAGAAAWDELMVVDRNPECAVAALSPDDRPLRLSIVASEWSTFFDAYLNDAALAPDTYATDAIVPSPLMPHLLAEWVVNRSRRRWPSRSVRVTPLERPPAVPWQRAGADDTHYVSFAEWMCPINCIEPARCPATKGERTWSMPVALQTHARDEHDDAFVFRCIHRTYGVGMIDVREVLDADASIASAASNRPLDVLIGTASHCHGALKRLVIG